MRSPMQVECIRQLFLDDEGVGETYRVARHYHSPVKYVGNPLLVGNAFHDAREGVRYEEDRVPREGGVEKFLSNVLVPTSVVRSPSGTFQMYYQTRPPGIKDFGYGGGSPVVAYAESHNGVHWRLPALNRVEINGSLENNVLFEPPGSLPCVVIDDHEADDARRYKMLYYPHNISLSPDGVSWSDVEKVHVPSRIGHSDGLNCLAGWDADIGRYVAYFRPQVARPDQAIDLEGIAIRIVARSESEDLTEWTELETVLAPDGDDPDGTEFQAIGVFFYEGMYVGLLCVHEGFAEERPKRFPYRLPNWPAHSAMLGRCYIELVTSRDGVHWNRSEGRVPFLDTTPGGLDSGVIWPSNSPVAVGDELWFYYGMAVHSHGLSYMQLPGLARLRRDGFVSMGALEQAGWMVTKPFVCPGGRLYVNADARGGELSASVIEQDGFHAPEYAMVRCATLDGNAMAYRLTWMERADLNPLKGKEIRLKFYLRQANLFSYWFE